MNPQPGHSNSRIDPQILKEAAAWLTQLGGDDISDAQRGQWLRWKESSPEHARAWERAEQLLGKIRVIPTQFSPVLDRPAPAARRQLFKALGITVVAGPLAWFSYRAYETKSGRTYSTAVGESRQLVLADGTAIVLNTDSAVHIDYNERHRMIRLEQGEVYVNSVPSMRLDQRPLTVVTADGWMRLQDCQCDVRRNNGRSEVAVIAGGLALTLAASDAHLQLGKLQSVSFTADRMLNGVRANTHIPAQTAWLDGAINAESMRLGDFIAELSRYRHGVLMCDPAIADLRISGVFQVADTDKILAVLQNTLPVTAVYRTPYWVSVVPRAVNRLRT